MGRKGYPLKYVEEISCSINKLCGDFDAESESKVRISDRLATYFVGQNAENRIEKQTAPAACLCIKIENYK